MLTAYFKEVLENYLTSIKVGKFNKNHEMFRLINYTITDAIADIVKDYNLSARGSSGAGTWTRYPWVAIYNEEITSTIQRGIYIVYLFSENMRKVYLSLNQGCTILKKDMGSKLARESMISTRQMVRDNLGDKRFNTDNDLDIGNLDYEIGSIYSKEYHIDNFPSEEEFIDDLKHMIKIYKEYYDKIFLADKRISAIPIKTGENNMRSKMRGIHNIMKSKGYIYSYEDLSNFYLSLKTKPFLLLAGISGTGKSKLVRLFSDAINGGNSKDQYNIINVKPDWNDSTELLGYKNINDKFVPGELTNIIKEASKKENTNKPYFVCLDEMNLARVEYYLAEYLSLIETRFFDDDKRILTDKVFPAGYLEEVDEYSNLRIPDNLYIVGTVNMDDTTFSFSRKVLDRVNTIEFSKVNLELLEFDAENNMEELKLDNSWLKARFLSIKDALNLDKEYVGKINADIIEINNILSMGNKQFGYRIRDEIVFYMLENKISELLDESVAFDYQIMQKILPTITGSERILKDILIGLYNYCNPSHEISDNIEYLKHGEAGLETALYNNSAEKILNMLRGYEDGYVSFW